MRESGRRKELKEGGMGEREERDGMEEEKRSKRKRERGWL